MNFEYPMVELCVSDSYMRRGQRMGRFPILEYGNLPIGRDLYSHYVWIPEIECMTMNRVTTMF